MASSISQQHGVVRTLYMLNAKNYLILESGVQFSITRNAKKVNKIVIKLNGNDLYDIEFWKIWGSNFTKLAEANDVHVESMHRHIEVNTELYLSLEKQYSF